MRHHRFMRRKTGSGGTVLVRLCRDELTIIIGGVTEAMWELGDDEFAIRVGPTADEARALLQRLQELRSSLSG
jgi:hypothetical protein